MTENGELLQTEAVMSLMIELEFTVMVPVAATDPQPPVSGIE
jgi:hypothetical protein